ncbi:hypothetical protein Tdes44962_MAKER04469 [Teratosphaeria destructans]|uniref:Uncharacterized protein n=1 Tax=Teratosphaeria destructans TaxID=418781 RepID=A0A9W7W0A8_9PEZI|nr:hypothetical protein Tdes44962_MAKER04469 [Teratosphaeria destructans]
MASSASIVYSTDRSGKGTYLDYSNSIGASSRTSSFKAAKEYAESFSSSTTTLPSQSSPRTVPSQPISLPKTTSTTPSSSRPNSARPSFMNYNNGAAAEELRRKPLPVLQTPVEAPAPPKEQAGQLIVFVGTELQQSTLRYVEIALQRKRFSGIAYVGSEEQAAALKQLKMDTYGVIGKLGLEAGVRIQYQQGHSPDSVKMAVEAVMKSAGDVQAVLCSLAYNTPETAATANILDVESNGLQTAWESSVGFLHSVARATIPTMIASSKASPQFSGFLLIQESAAQDPVSLFMQSSANALLRQLREACGSATPNLDIGNAAGVLVPLPEPIKPNGHEHAPRQNGQAASEIYQPGVDFSGGESPTKLYSMWAMHESLVDYL